MWRQLHLKSRKFQSIFAIIYQTLTVLVLLCLAVVEMMNHYEQKNESAAQVLVQTPADDSVNNEWWHESWAVIGQRRAALGCHWSGGGRLQTVSTNCYGEWGPEFPEHKAFVADGRNSTKPVDFLWSPAWTEIGGSLRGRQGKVGMSVTVWQCSCSRNKSFPGNCDNYSTRVSCSWASVWLWTHVPVLCRYVDM